MKREFMKYSIVALLCIIFLSCSIFQSKNSELVELKDGTYQLRVNTTNLQFGFTDKKENTIVPNDSVSGLIINESPVVEATLKSGSDNQLIFDVTTKANELAEVIIVFKDGVSTISVEPEKQGINKVSLRFGGMLVAHGLGDAGAFGESFNLVEKQNKTYDITNNGGTKRWLSTFTIFPKNQFAGVFFNKGKKSVVLGPNTYQLNSETEGEATFYFFIGTNQEIYSNFKKIRNELGYEDIKPKPRLFELGWESWDALGWNTNQETVKDILAKFHKEGYPIRWAVTGSGFWETGGITTNFGKWGEKFSDAQSFKTWMHNQDIKWMIGLRTNFVPKGGPYIPLSSKRDRNLKGNSYNGNSISDEGLKNNYFVKDVNGIPATYISRWFPQVPCYLLDGNVQGAAQWYLQKYRKWKVDGIKEDTMMDIDSLIGIYNLPITEIAKDDGLVMARNGSFVSSGTLQRINDTGVANMSKRAPINYFQYAACGYPNVYSDVAGIHNIHNLKGIDASIRHSWLLSLTAGMAVGAFPEKWPIEKQAAFKKAVDFHYSLVPYLFSAGMKSFETGFPYTLTPMSIAFPNDENAMEPVNFQWMLGESLLAAPLLKNHKSGKMDIYLPQGKWFDWETQEEYIGPTTLSNYEIALDKTPCFVGGNGIILLRNTNNQQLKVRVYKVDRKAKTQFFSLKNSEKYEIEVSETDLNKVEIWDSVSKQNILFQIEKNYIEFEINEGHNYQVK